MSTNDTKSVDDDDKEVTEADVMCLNETIDIDGEKYTLAQIKAALKKNV